MRCRTHRSSIDDRRVGPGPLGSGGQRAGEDLPREQALGDQAQHQVPPLAVGVAAPRADRCSPAAGRRWPALRAAPSVPGSSAGGRPGARRPPRSRPVRVPGCRARSRRPPGRGRIGPLPFRHLTISLLMLDASAPAEQGGPEPGCASRWGPRRRSARWPAVRAEQAKEEVPDRHALPPTIAPHRTAPSATPIHTTTSGTGPPRSRWSPPSPGGRSRAPAPDDSDRPGTRHDRVIDERPALVRWVSAEDHEFMTVPRTVERTGVPVAFPPRD